MSHFYGTMKGSRGETTRCGTKASGLRTQAAGWRGCIETRIYHDPETGADRFVVELRPWHYSGGRTYILSEGYLDANGSPVRDGEKRVMLPAFTG